MLVVSDLQDEYNGLKSTITARQCPTTFTRFHDCTALCSSIPHHSQTEFIFKSIIHHLPSLLWLSITSLYRFSLEGFWYILLHLLWLHCRECRLGWLPRGDLLYILDQTWFPRPHKNNILFLDHDHLQSPSTKPLLTRLLNPLGFKLYCKNLVLLLLQLLFYGGTILEQLGQPSLSCSFPYKTCRGWFSLNKGKSCKWRSSSTAHISNRRHLHKAAGDSEVSLPTVQATAPRP